MLSNLLDNAVQHARAHIHLSSRPGPDGTVDICVDDDGPGVPVEQRELVFGKVLPRPVSRQHRPGPLHRARPGRGPKWVGRPPRRHRTVARECASRCRPGRRTDRCRCGWTAIPGRSGRSRPSDVRWRWVFSCECRCSPSASLVTIHVVTALGRSYTAAGVAAMVSTAAIGLGAPWRGRLLDRYGLRAVVGPAIVQLLVGAAIPFLPYAPLLAALAVSGLFVIPRPCADPTDAHHRRPRRSAAHGSPLTGSCSNSPPPSGLPVAVGVATSWSTPLDAARRADGQCRCRGPPLAPRPADPPQDAVPEAPVSPGPWLGARFLAIPRRLCDGDGRPVRHRDLGGRRPCVRPTARRSSASSRPPGASAPLVGGLAYRRDAAAADPAGPAPLPRPDHGAAAVARTGGPERGHLAGLGASRRSPPVSRRSPAWCRQARGRPWGWHGSGDDRRQRGMGAPLAGLVIRCSWWVGRLPRTKPCSQWSSP